MVDFAEITIGKIKENGEELFEIRKFGNIVNIDDVPREYITKSPAFALANYEDEDILMMTGQPCMLIGDKYTRDEIEEIQTYLAEASDRLTQVTQKLEKLTRDHSGEYIFTIGGD